MSISLKRVSQLYQMLILQEGASPLMVDGTIQPQVEHRCTATLVWPVGETPHAVNSLIVDPSFSEQGCEQADNRLTALGISLKDVEYYFSTHAHWDHCPRGSEVETLSLWRAWRPSRSGPLAGLSAVHCPGHAADLQALRFDTVVGETWAVGDAILDRQWLLAWGFYWPNGYGEAEIVQTWRSVAAILARAAQVIPGHGPAFAVDVALLDALIAGFPCAFYAGACPEVLQALQLRRACLAATLTEPGVPG